MSSRRCGAAAGPQIEHLELGLVRRSPATPWSWSGSPWSAKGNTPKSWGPGSTLPSPLRRRRADAPEDAVVAVACTAPRKSHSVADGAAAVEIVGGDPVSVSADGTDRDVASGLDCIRERW